MATDTGPPLRRRPLIDRIPAVVWPTLAATGAAAAVAMVHLVDPHEPGNYPTCPWLTLTGTYCPGCGSMRAVAALTHLDLAGAAQMNLLLLLAIPLLIWGWVNWMRRSLRPQAGPPSSLLLRPRWIWLLLAAFLVFAVIRNLPFGVLLAPGGMPAAEFLG